MDTRIQTIQASFDCLFMSINLAESRVKSDFGRGLRQEEEDKERPDYARGVRDKEKGEEKPDTLEDYVKKARIGSRC